MTVGRLSKRARTAALGALALGLAPVAVHTAEPRSKPGIEKLECRSAKGESSIRITAFDLAGEPAEGLWIDALSNEHGREQSLQVDAGGVGKLWVGRDRAYEIYAYGPQFEGYLRLREVRVPLGCELQVRVTVLRNSGGTIIII
jgi:hypothetical protein